MVSLSEKAKLIEKEWEEFNLPDTCIEQFVFHELFELEVSQYNLKDILSLKAISSVIDNGIKVIDAYKSGKKLYTLGARGSEAEIPSEQQYIELFKKWELAGWVKMEEDKEGVINVKLV